MKSGRSYGIFDCNASKQRIQAELPKLRRLTGTPSDLELSIRDIDDVRGDSDLMPRIRDAKKAGMRYVAEADCPNATNADAARALTIISNQGYQSPLWKKDEPYRGEIIHKENGKYAFAA